MCLYLKYIFLYKYDILNCQQSFSLLFLVDGLLDFSLCEAQRVMLTDVFVLIKGPLFFRVRRLLP